METTIERVGSTPADSTRVGKTPVRPPIRATVDKAVSNLSRGDDFTTIRKVEHEVINIGTTVDHVLTTGAKISRGQPFPPALPFDNVLGNMKASAKQQAITSVIRNGIALAMHKETPAQAGGHVVGDVSIAAIDAGASALVGNIAMGIAAAVGASSLPVLIVGMAAGYLTTKILDKKVNYPKDGHGLYEKIVTKTTDALHKAGLK